MEIPKPGATYVYPITGGHYRVVGGAKLKMGGEWVEGWVVYAALGNRDGEAEGTLYVRQREEFFRYFEEVRVGAGPRPEEAKGPEGSEGKESPAPAGRGESAGKEEGKKGEESAGTGLGVEGPEGLEPRLEPRFTAVRARKLARGAQADGERWRVLGVVLGAVEGAARRGERARQVVWEEVCPGGPWMPTLVRMELSRLGFAVEALEGAPDLGLCVRW